MNAVKSVIWVGCLITWAGPAPLRADGPPVFVYQQPHMGCLFTLKLVTEDEKAAQAASEAVSKRIEEIEQVCSDYRKDSESSLLSATGGQGKAVKVSDELCALLTASEHFWQWSGGTFDVTLGPCTRLWRTTRKTLQLPSPATLAAAVAATGFPQLHFSAPEHTVQMQRSGMVLDFGGIAKGYALEEATQLLLKTTGIRNFLLDAAGQIAAMGAPPERDAWSLGIEKLPEETPDTPAVVLKLHNAHLATSGDLHQRVTIGDEHYAHILNPQTGLGLTYTVEASVIAPDGTTADAVATALCILDEPTAREKLRQLPGVEARVLRQLQDGTLHVWQSEGWSAYVK